MNTQRWKLGLADGRTVYVYKTRVIGDHVCGAMVVSVERAGHYDSETNTVHMTEPTSIQEGRVAPGA